MERILSGYDINNATWFYLSLLLTLAVYFKFTRVWSVRNLDLATLLAFSPGFLLAAAGYAAGYVWLFIGSAYFLVRAAFDPAITRRPLLEPNINVPGLAFLGLSTLAFLMAEAIANPTDPAGSVGARQAQYLLERQPVPPDEPEGYGPAYGLLHLAVALPCRGVAAIVGENPDAAMLVAVPRAMAILCHLAIVLGIVMVAQLHFGRLSTGIAAATLYLMLPCTAYHVHGVDHVLPAALVVWAVVAYRRPFVSGGLLGLAAGALYFPVFLLPLWARFYSWRGALRFGVSLAAVLALLLGTIAYTSPNAAAFVRQAVSAVSWSQWNLSSVQLHAPDHEGQPAPGAGAAPQPLTPGPTSVEDGPAASSPTAEEERKDVTLEGAPVTTSFWEHHQSVYRLPVFAGFLVLCAGLSIWPCRKNLNHLIAFTAAVLIGTQFWYARAGGSYILWYLPLLLLVVFRPNLSDRTAPQIHPLGWFRRRRKAAAAPPPSESAQPQPSPHEVASLRSVAAPARGRWRVPAR